MSARKRPLNILVPRLVDKDNYNAQNLNAKALLSRFTSPDVIWHTFYYNTPDPAVSNRGNVRCHRLIHGRLWRWHAILKYLGRFDAIFYPGNECFDARALKWRTWMGRKIPVIATLEGLPGDEDREKYLSGKAGHPVYCFRPRSGPDWVSCHDDVRKFVDLNIAISPFLKRIGEHLYGDKFSVLPTGVNTAIFNTNGRDGFPDLPIVLGAGTLYEAKRPEVFIRLASSFPMARFVWYGDGPLRKELINWTEREGLSNLSFPGSLSPNELANRFKKASMFVLPSFSEGVPKVTQEAAACGLPVVLFGLFESPSVIDGNNGFVVWDDEELFARIAELLESAELKARMGQNGARLANNWDWDELAPQWEAAIKSFIASLSLKSKTIR
jgi:glycosyltransferase involved in cell wall biosynthesis